jgi:cytochrome c-type biogenesis protein CcmH
VARKRIKRAVWVILLVALALLPVMAAAPVYAQGGGEPVREVTADEVNEISSKLYCPVCENIPLDVCGTAACARWREQVRTLLEEGSSEEQVIDYFVEQFGERVVGTPLDPTLNFFSWAVPAGSVILGLIIVVVVFIRWRNPVDIEDDADDVDESIPGEDDDYRSRLERELRELE